MSNFSTWTLTKLEHRFGLKMLRKPHPVMEAWLAGQSPLEDSELEQVDRLQKTLFYHVSGWNEQELSLHFIGPMLSLADIRGETFDTFAGRTFSAVVDGEELAGIPDGMIASGFREPEKPYFCLQEYKRERDPDGDPAGQCMAAMLAAQALNGDRQPVFGAFIIGRMWVFMLLDGKSYVQSKDFSGVDEGAAILRVLRNLRSIIEARVNACT